MTTVSNTTTAVLNNIAKSYSNSSLSAVDSGVFFTTNASSPASASGFLAPAVGGSAVQYSITTTTESTSGNTYVIPLGWQGQYSGMPYIGDPLPNSGSGFVFPPQIQTPFKVVPDLESLEEGIHDIPGGKVIIKKIKISEEQLDSAIQETLGHEASAEEKATIIKEIEELSASEEREV